MLPDLEDIEEANQNREDGLINFLKIREIADTLERFKKGQQCPYNITRDAKIKKFFRGTQTMSKLFFILRNYFFTIYNTNNFAQK